LKTFAFPADHLAKEPLALIAIISVDEVCEAERLQAMKLFAAQHPLQSWIHRRDGSLRQALRHAQWGVLEELSEF
jgi:hypothetical protein